MKIIKYIIEAIFIYLLFLLMKLIGLNLGRRISSYLFLNIGGFFRSKKLIKENISNALGNVTDDKIYCDQLQRKDVDWFRVTLSGKPTTNNTLVKMRVNYYNKDADGSVTFNFQKNFVDQNMEDGADVSHTKEFTVPFYVGSDDTIRGYGELEVNCNTDTIITDVAMLSVVN